MNIYQFHTNPESLDFYEERLTRVPKLAYEHAKSLDRRFPEGEAAIAKSATYAYWYALLSIKEKFPAGEAAIAKDAWYAYLYARYVIKGRFPEGEAAIAKDTEYACLYARYVIKGRFPEGEAAIANSEYKNEYEREFNVKI
jgi:hypothetical protein